MDLLYLVRVLLKRKWIIIGAAILAAFIAWFFTRNESKYYKSTTRISTGFNISEDITLTETKIFEADVRFNNAINTFQSPSVISLLSYQIILHDLDSSAPFRKLNKVQLASPVLKQVNLANAKNVFRNRLETMSMLTSFKPEEKKLLDLLTLYGYDYKSLSQALNIYRVNGTDYIEINSVTENPELSAYMVNNIYNQFIRYYSSMRISKSQQSIDTLQSIMEKKKLDLDEKNRLLRGENTIDATTESASKLDIIANLEQTLMAENSKQTESFYALRKVNQKLAALSGGTTTTGQSGPESNNEEAVIARKAMNDAYKEYLKVGDQTTLAKYNKLKDEYQKKLNGSNSSGSAIEPSSNRAQLLESKSDLESDIQASKDKISAIESRINALKGNISSVSKRGADVETMMEEVKLAEREYFEAKTKYSNAVDISSSTVNNFRPLQLAQPAIEAEPSKRKMIVGMAGVVTFLSCILIIVLLTYLDSSIKTPVIFSKAVNLKMISMVNFKNLKHRNLKDLVAGNVNEVDLDEKKRSNVFRESIRKLRYEVERDGKKIFLFTSTSKGEGKTTLIQALAYSMSLSRKRILVIDTNFCNNDITVQTGAKPVLEKMTSQDVESIRSEIKEKSVMLAENVYVLGSEGGDYTPSEILPNGLVLKHLQSLTDDFDYIFLEGPPLNDFSDSRELVKYVDGVIAIFSATKIIKQIDKDSIQFFKELNGKFSGSVLNKVDLENVNAI